MKGGVKMKSKKLAYNKILVLFCIIAVSVLMTGCVGPIVNIFSAIPSTINQGESSTLTWSVSDADTVTITSIGTVTSSGSTIVSPVVTTDYILTATNSTGSVTATATVTVIECIDFESLTIGKVYNVGDTFTDSGVTITVLPFQWGSGLWTSGGSARVVDNELAGVSGKEINVNNVNLGFNFSGPLKGLSLNFGEYGGNLNIEINDDFKNFENFVDINTTSIGGVNVSVINGYGNDKGRLTLSGEMGMFDFQKQDFMFVIGGQELWVDHVCPSL
jgi:hypothetical protein